MSLASILPWLQIILSILLVGVILVQQNEGSLGSAFGGMTSGPSFRTKRGPEKFFFISTIVLAILFAISSIIALVIH